MTQPGRETCPVDLHYPEPAAADLDLPAIVGRGRRIRRRQRLAKAAAAVVACAAVASIAVGLRGTTFAWFPGHSESPAGRAVTPGVLAGTVRLVPDPGGSFAIQLDGRHGVTSYDLWVSPIMWRDKYGNWFDGSQPACLKPRSHGQHITFGVVNVKPGPASGGPVVVWIECARSPVPRYPIVTPKASGPP